MRIAIIMISAAGEEIARLLQQHYDAQKIERSQVGPHWHDYEAFVFIGAIGICVRTIAPHLTDKHHDPAVVCIDTTGRHVVPVLSGHVGGANQLATDIAAVTGSEAVVTTQSDNSGLWALDTLHRQFHWGIAGAPDHLNDVIIPFVNRAPTALLLDIRDAGTDYLERTLPNHVKIVDNISQITPDRYRVAVIVSHLHHTHPEGVACLQFVPRILTMGIGLAHQAKPVEEIMHDIRQLLFAQHIHPSAIQKIATIDVKADEPVICQLISEGHQVLFYTADQLRQVEVPTPSETVARHVSTPSVSEAAALLAAPCGELVVTKQKDEKKRFTIAIAASRYHLRRGHIEIVGAGPGAPDLISVRGRQMLEIADLILYAGSLVPKELTACAKRGATIKSSATMTLEQQCELMEAYYRQGKFIVRLHTGDPCIFGAIQEQMAFFDQRQMDYHITPGISSFQAAAAELRSQFTIPERTQTIILTRGEGRTPMPEREKLHLLARSRSTMCIFLSAAIVDDVQRELLSEYPGDTPVAACYHLTWPDQRIYRGVLRDLAHIVHKNQLTLTTMIVVGEAIDNRQGLSELYSSHFTHLYRKGDR